MKLSYLDLQGSLSKKPSQEDLDKYTSILENPDLLGRLYRLFVYQNTRPGLWKDLFDKYLEDHGYESQKWHRDKQTNLKRSLFDSQTVTWRKFLEGLVILSPAFDTLSLEVFTNLNGGKPTILRIRPKSLILDDAEVGDIPKGELLIPSNFHRSPLEPLPLKVVRDTISTLGTSDEFRRIVRENIVPYTHSSKISSTTNSLYVSVLKSNISWKRMMTILFAIGASSLMVQLVATKNGKTYTTITQVKK